MIGYLYLRRKGRAQICPFLICGVVLSIITMLSGLWYMRLSPQARADISGTAEAGDPKTVIP